MTTSNRFRTTHLLPTPAGMLPGEQVNQFAPRVSKAPLPPVVLDPCPERDGRGHVYRLPTPAGPTVTGTCRLCGKAREFPSSSEGSVWEMRGERSE